MKPIIVGVDPGTTTAYAVLNSRGELIALDSSRLFDISTLISEVIKYGNPMLVGCDKHPAPSFVERFAVKVGAKLVAPPEDLLQEEKRAMVSMKTNNDHEADALACAVYAFNNYKELLDKVDITLERKGKQELSENLKYIVVKEGLSISEGLNVLEKVDEEKDEGSVKIRFQVVRPQKEIQVLEKELNLQEEKKKELRKRIKELEKENKKLKKRIEGMPVDKILEQKDNAIKLYANRLENEEGKIAGLHSEIDHLKGFVAMSSGKILVKKMRNLSQKEYEKKQWLNMQRGDVLLVDDPNVASSRVLEDLRSKVHVIIHRAKLTVSHEGFTFLNASDLDLDEISDFALISKKELELGVAKKDVLKRVVLEYKKKREV
ncbi:DUF460 domain-containing protein [Nanoarchaeota archaeon]